MTRIRPLIAVAGLCLWVASAYAQVRVDGQVYGLVYATENRQDTQLWDLYQGLQLNLRSTGKADLSFKTHLLAARRGDPAEWEERIYNAYLDWRSSDRGLQARLGRQFLYRGVINGSVDGLLLRVQPTDDLDLQVVGGVAVPFDRRLDVDSWDDGGMLGGYAAYRVSSAARLDASYVRRTRDGETSWHQMGAGLAGDYGDFFYQARLDYNLERSTYQLMRYRLTWQPGPWSFAGEFNSQKPRIFEDSFFNIFELEGFDQVRGGAAYRLGRYEVGLQLLHTMFEEDETADEVIATVGSGWGTIGFVYQTGFGGDNVGLYGAVRYDLLPNLTLRLHSSHYSYERRSLISGEEATSFSGGFLYRPFAPLLLQAEVQESINPVFDNDLRVLLRVSYALRHR